MTHFLTNHVCSFWSLLISTNVIKSCFYWQIILNVILGLYLNNSRSDNCCCTDEISAVELYIMLNLSYEQLEQVIPLL